MRAIRLLLAFTVAVVSCAAVPNSPRAEITNRIVARVNSDIITLHELNAAIKNLIGASAMSLRQKDEARFYEVRRAVLDNLINDKIAAQEIVKLGIIVTTKDIDEAIEKVKNENKLTHEELLHSLELEGITLKEYKTQLKREIERFRLVNYEIKSKIVITDEDARTYYENHVKGYGAIHEVRLARIFLQVRDPGDTEEIARVKERGREILLHLEEGRDFFEMAKGHSQGPAAEEGGDLGWIKLSQIEPSLREKIANLSPGGYTDLVPASSGFQIITLLEERKGDVEPFEAMKDSIYSKLFKEKVEERYTVWISRLRKKSFIKVIF